MTWQDQLKTPRKTEITYHLCRHNSHYQIPMKKIYSNDIIDRLAACKSTGWSRRVNIMERAQTAPELANKLPSAPHPKLRIAFAKFCLFNITLIRVRSKCVRFFRLRDTFDAVWMTGYFEREFYVCIDFSIFLLA